MILKIVFTYITALFMLSGCMYKTELDIKELGHKKDVLELKSIMEEIDVVVYDNSKSELELDNVRRRYAINLAQKIKILTTKSKTISDDELKQTIAPENIGKFHKYMEELSKNGDAIYEVANNYELKKLDKKIDDMKQTCVSCHTNVRGY